MCRKLGHTGIPTNFDGLVDIRVFYFQTSPLGCCLNRGRFPFVVCTLSATKVEAMISHKTDMLRYRTWLPIYEWLSQEPNYVRSGSGFRMNTASHYALFVVGSHQLLTIIWLDYIWCWDWVICSGTFIALAFPKIGAQKLCLLNGGCPSRLDGKRCYSNMARSQIPN